MGIVETIAKQGRPLKFSEIQELTQITKSNLYKYLNTFTQLCILYRNSLNLFHKMKIMNCLNSYCLLAKKYRLASAIKNKRVAPRFLFSNKKL
ncbi:helix-turn-helix domain-containing protein [Neobacillus niacini]